MRPGIVGPTLAKAELPKVLATHWAWSIDAIRTAEQIWVIGYSFPKTDAYIPKLLAEGIRDNEALELLVIADIEKKKKWKQRIEQLFSDKLAARKFHYQPGNAADTMTALAKCGYVTDWVSNVRAGMLTKA